MSKRNEILAAVLAATSAAAVHAQSALVGVAPPVHPESPASVQTLKAVEESSPWARMTEPHAQTSRTPRTQRRTRKAPTGRRRRRTVRRPRGPRVRPNTTRRPAAPTAFTTLTGGRLAAPTGGLPVHTQVGRIAAHAEPGSSFQMPWAGVTVLPTSFEEVGGPRTGTVLWEMTTRDLATAMGHAPTAPLPYTWRPYTSAAHLLLSRASDPKRVRAELGLDPNGKAVPVLVPALNMGAQTASVRRALLDAKAHGANLTVGQAE